jgi:hypothetical protein
VNHVEDLNYFLINDGIFLYGDLCLAQNQVQREPKCFAARVFSIILTLLSSALLFYILKCLFALDLLQCFTFNQEIEFLFHFY